MSNEPRRAAASAVSLALLLALASCEFKDGGILPEEIQTPPVAEFTVRTAPAEGGVLVTADASASTDAQDATDVLEVRWDWESDGTWDTPFATEKIATHLYMTGAGVAIRLQVRDSSGLMGVASELTNWVLPLSCDVTVAPLSGQAPLVVQFAPGALGGTGEYRYKWRFGDGGRSELAAPEHTYEDAGEWTAILELSDGRLPGVVSADSVRVAVSARSEPRPSRAPIRLR